MWEDEGQCSATCGQGTKKRVRYLKAQARVAGSAENPAESSMPNLLDGAILDYELTDGFQRSGEEHLHNVVLSFLVGAVFAVAAVLMAIVGGT